MIQIDGSHGEGGGQILRSSLALSLITGQPFHMKHIRANRSRPGLQPQHLMSVQAAAEIGSAKTSGAALKSQSLTFEPGTVQAGQFHFPIHTAGATGLVLHTIYLPLALTGQNSRVTIDGGTHVPTSPCFHFLQTTWANYMRRLGLHIDLRMSRPGFYPRGGGRIEADIQGTKQTDLRPLQLESVQMPRRVEGFSAVAGLPQSIAQRQARRARERLEHADCEVDIHEETWPGGPGTVVGLTIPTAPAPSFFFSIGARGKWAETVADEAVDQALDFLNRERPAIDEHSADQLVLPAALTPAPSRFRATRLTRHVRTNVDVMRLFLPRPIRCLDAEGEEGWLETAADNSFSS